MLSLWGRNTFRTEALIKSIARELICLLLLLGNRLIARRLDNSVLWLRIGVRLVHIISRPFLGDALIDPRLSFSLALRLQG